MNKEIALMHKTNNSDALIKIYEKARLVEVYKNRLMRILSSRGELSSKLFNFRTSFNFRIPENWNSLKWVVDEAITSLGALIAILKELETMENIDTLTVPINSVSQTNKKGKNEEIDIDLKIAHFLADLVNTLFYKDHSNRFVEAEKIKEDIDTFKGRPTFRGAYISHQVGQWGSEGWGHFVAKEKIFYVPSSIITIFLEETLLYTYYYKQYQKIMSRTHFNLTEEEFNKPERKIELLYRVLRTLYSPFLNNVSANPLLGSGSSIFDYPKEKNRGNVFCKYWSDLMREKKLTKAEELRTILQEQRGIKVLGRDGIMEEKKDALYLYFIDLEKWILWNIDQYVTAFFGKHFNVVIKDTF